MTRRWAQYAGKASIEVTLPVWAVCERHRALACLMLPDLQEACPLLIILRSATTRLPSAETTVTKGVPGTGTALCRDPFELPAFLMSKERPDKESQMLNPGDPDPDSRRVLLLPPRKRADL